ncbi:Na(+)/H(+) antiporter subunit D [Candidatus Endobugula sertula]|uniref:Na(+)/H(+) antiporter subunit D n=1 Tax=Candidatus Endobugula sertula TaxID=62101 RepID=A0A1D2QU88_9GAMM|nr:Na(+)/H(+) antiporter subunit D [Candidatus Endobugula sertula]
MNEFVLSLPPFAWFFIGAVLLLVCRGVIASAITIIMPIVSFMLLLQWDHGTDYAYPLMGMDLTLVRVDRLSLLFAYLFHLAALIGGIFALHEKDKVQQIAALAYAGSAIGAVFAGDWISLFVFWELLALTSVFLVWARRTSASYHSGMRYLIIQVLSGVLLFAGALLLIRQTGSIAFTDIGLSGIGAWLIFIAFGIKCGFPFFHSWITDAYPEATPTGTVFLCAMTTKVAVYALARSFAGEDILVTIGLVMACFPIFFAVIENDLRRVLAYSMINQIGFMVCGIGIGTEMAINGAVAHAFNDVIFKGLLMMSMGAVLFRVGHVKGSHLGGLYRSMPKTTMCCIVGAASISAFPLFSGFISKSIIMLEMLEAGHTVGWLLLLFAAAGVFHHAGIKIPFFAFFAHDSGLKVKEAPANMLIAMGIAAILCIFIGSYPSFLYSLLPFPIHYSPYDVTHVLTQMQLLFFSALAFVWLNLKGLYPPELPSTNIDSEWLYRRVAPAIVSRVVVQVEGIYILMKTALLKALNHLIILLSYLSSPQSPLARAWSVNGMLLALLILMIVVLLFNYF